MSEPTRVDRPDPGAIGPLIERLQQLQAEGVTHVHAYSCQGRYELVTGVADTRVVWNDGANISVHFETENNEPRVW